VESRAHNSLADKYIFIGCMEYGLDSRGLGRTTITRGALAVVAMRLLANSIGRLLLRRQRVLARVPVQLARQDLADLRRLSSLSGDFFRASTLCMVAKEINESGLPGNAAEVGVYRGDFAFLINSFFPNRTLYLFDTFQGFGADEFEKDRKEGLTFRWQPFRTDSGQLLRRMPHPEKVIVKQGHFPDTASDLQESFVFVSLDVDLYTPTIAGLEYFYPRLVEGGYIFVHDFNHPDYMGNRKAVLEFCARNIGLSYVPIGDWGGTAILKRQVEENLS
jgi:O-methyltransferase